MESTNSVQYYAQKIYFAARLSNDGRRHFLHRESRSLNGHINRQTHTHTSAYKFHIWMIWLANFLHFTFKFAHWTLTSTQFHWYRMEIFSFLSFLHSLFHLLDRSPLFHVRCMHFFIHHIFFDKIKKSTKSNKTSERFVLYRLLKKIFWARNKRKGQVCNIWIEIFVYSRQSHTCMHVYCTFYIVNIHSSHVNVFFPALSKHYRLNTTWLYFEYNREMIVSVSVDIHFITRNVLVLTVQSHISCLPVVV